MTGDTSPQPNQPPLSRLTCERVTAMIIDYVSDDMDATTTANFEAHLGNCPDCVAFLKTYRETIRETRSLRYEDLPEEMRARSLQFFREKITSTPSDG